MNVKVHLCPLGSGLAPQETLSIYCGAGQQILQWLAQAACLRLAHQRGGVSGQYVPQSVVSKDGQVLDVDLVLCEALREGEEVYVEYGVGPTPFRVRWEGRPPTPPFQWSNEDGGCELVQPHDAWLQNLDLRAEGVGALLGPEPSSPEAREAAAADLAAVKRLLVEHAGMLQMLLFHATCQGSADVDALCRLTLPQFKALAVAARATTGAFTPERLDEVFATVAMTESALARRGDAQGAAASWLGLPDFMVALVHVAHHRYVADSFAVGASAAPLSTQLLSLLQDCVYAHLLPDKQRHMERLAASLTPAAALLLRKGRRLTEQTLERCQVKRTKPHTLHVEVRYVAAHLQQWGLLGREFVLSELGPLALFALQRTCDATQFELLPQPLALGYDDFERLLLGIAAHLYGLRKQAEPFEEFLGDVLGTIYRKAGVLLELAPPATPAGQPTPQRAEPSRGEGGLSGGAGA